jgi:hypothetical protein
MQEIMRRLHKRGPANPGIAVDAEGAMLGPDCVLVRRTPRGYRSIDAAEAVALQKCLSGDRRDADWLFGQCRRIAKALDNRDLALAQIYGIYLPLGDLDAEQRKRLALAAPLTKAGFDPDEPRIPAGEPGGGEWTSGSGAAAPTPGGREPLLIPAQMTIPWDLPTDIPWDIPGAPSEITPIPFDFPGAKRERPPLPTNPFPRDPECAAEWAAAQEYCEKMDAQGKLRAGPRGRKVRGYSGPGKDMRSCLLGQVSERCGGNPIA